MPVHNEDIARIFEQIADLLEIEDANPFRVDILEDGGLDMPDEVLARLDLVIGAVHRKKDVLNTRPLPELRRLLNKARG